MEAIGATTSIIGLAEFALTVGKAISRLRRLWVEVQEAPETVRDLKQEVAVIETIFSGLFPSPTSTSVRPEPLLDYTPTNEKLPAFCREALANLQDLVEDLSSEIESSKKPGRRLAKLKTILKKGNIEKFQKTGKGTSSAPGLTFELPSCPGWLTLSTTECGPCTTGSSYVSVDIGVTTLDCV